MLYTLPDEILEKIFLDVHKSFLKDVHMEIKYGWPIGRRIIYNNKFYAYFLHSEMSNKSVRNFNDYLDFKKGKIINILDNVYYKIECYAL